MNFEKAFLNYITALYSNNSWFFQTFISNEPANQSEYCLKKTLQGNTIDKMSYNRINEPVNQCKCYQTKISQGKTIDTLDTVMKIFT
jgi:hypothetical protein